MKIIRPQNNTPTKKQLLDEITAISQECKMYDEELIDDNTGKDQTIENLMDEVIATDINENKLKVTILFTERQYNLWKNKGGEKWLKRALVGQKYSPHGRGKKKKK